MELNEIFLISVPNGWRKQAFIQDFYCKTITLKYVNMFERMEIDEIIYEGVVEISYLKNCYRKF